MHVRKKIDRDHGSDCSLGGDEDCLDVFVAIIVDSGAGSDIGELA